MKNKATTLMLLLFLSLSATIAMAGGTPQCTVSGDPSFCTGSSTNLCVAAGASNYLWSRNGTNLGINSNCISANAPGSYSVFITNIGGPSMSCGINVTENTLPDFTVSSQLNLPCGTTETNLNIVLNSQAAVNYSTTVDNNFGNVNSGGTSSTPNVAVPGSYKVVVTNQNTGCSASTFAGTGTLGGTCIFCNQNTVTVSSDITINFNTTPATYTGDPALLPYFSEDRSGGATPDKWKAIFNMGTNRLLITNNSIIQTKRVNKYAPGMDFRGLCDFIIETGSEIYAEGDDKNAGDLIIQFNGNIYVAGTIRDEVTDNDGLPGQIVIATKCGDINIAETGLVTAIGEDKGGNDVSLLACGQGCFNPTKSVNGVPGLPGYSGNINVAGLVSSYAEADKGNQSLHRPNVKVVSFNGMVSIYANSADPLYDEFVRHGIKYDLFGGLLSWTDKNAKPGKVEVQARGDIMVEGHGTDPSGAVRKSFGAIAAAGVGPGTVGGLVDVRSLEGKIDAFDRAFDVAGKNRLFTNVAKIKLHAHGDINLSRVGTNNNFNPVLDARSPVAGGRGGTNDIRSYMGGISIGNSARVLASTPSGSGSVQGVNLLESCTGVSNNGTVTPADLIPGNNTGSCNQYFPPAMYEACWDFPIQIDVRLKAEEQIFHSDLNVYPNPTDGRFTLQFNSAAADKYRVTVISMTGTIVMDKLIDAAEGNNSEEIDLTNISKGMYILMLSGKDVKEQKRITLQ